MRKISTSFLTSKNVPMDLIKLNATDADLIHVDVMDGKFVKNKTMPFSEMKNIYKFTTKRLEVHLMVENPSKYIPMYAELNTECIMFHIEVEEDIIKNLELIKSFSIKCGLAISPDTKISDLIPYLPYLDEILVMGVYPGAGGQKFILSTADRIKEIKELIKSYGFNILINVDGGVCLDILDKVESADILTVGNYVLSGDDYQEKITSLR
ncbi:MAG: ribulose-phosphate 3-epimerase [Bacilli bacterium]|nr:ribulose-phosphate 3-epimerase [Bacilli bacterium]